MNYKSIPLLIMALSLQAISGTAFSDDDDRGGSYSKYYRSSGSSGVAPVNNKKYQDECGSCHFAYQPGLLPARSWSKMMHDLENHFGENAELVAEDVAQISQYLEDNAADRSSYKRSRKIMKSMRSSSTPLRITETPYIIRKHDELSHRMVEDNPQVVSISRCKACHTRAETGSYSESQINIPGVGRWHD